MQDLVTVGPSPSNTHKFSAVSTGGVDRVEVSTVVHLPAEEVYEFLEDFPGYAEYSKYLTNIEQEGDGGPGTFYGLTFSWWKLSYTARSKVTSVEPPNQINWAIIKHVNAKGCWRVDPEPESAPEGVETASRVRFIAEFDPDSADSSAIDLPRMVSMDWVIKKVKPKVLEEAERIVERVVVDLEGKRRDVELEVHETPSSV